MEFEIKSRFDDLYNHNDWSKDEHKFLKPYACKPDVMYGLCKVYEGTTGNDNVPPFRPILPAIDTGSYNLVTFFVPILKQFTIDIYSVINSFSFSKKILDQDPNLFMTFFDFQSLLHKYFIGSENWHLCWPGFWKEKEIKKHA